MYTAWGYLVKLQCQKHTERCTPDINIAIELTSVGLAHARPNNPYKSGTRYHRLATVALAAHTWQTAF